MYIMLVYPIIVNECTLCLYTLNWKWMYIMLVYPSIVNECTLC